MEEWRLVLVKKFTSQTNLVFNVLRSLTSLLKLGALQSILTASYHFFIPYQFGWDKYLKDESSTINWALISINNYYSFNLLIAGSFLLYFLFEKEKRVGIILILAMMLLIHWIFSVGYQILFPMPLPYHLGWLIYLLLGVAIVNVTLFAIPLVKSIKLNH